MSAQQLTDLMISAGVSSYEAQRRAESYIADKEAEEKLSKSLEVLEEISFIQKETESRQEERLSKALTEGQNNMASVIAPALDDLLKEQRAQNNALAKGLTGVLDLIKSLKADINFLRDNQKPAKAPLVKSVDFIPSPQEEMQVSSRDDLFKSLSDTLASHPERANELLNAVTLLESGADPVSVKQKYNL